MSKRPPITKFSYDCKIDGNKKIVWFKITDKNDGSTLALDSFGYFGDKSLQGRKTIRFKDEHQMVMKIQDKFPKYFDDPKRLKPEDIVNRLRDKVKEYEYGSKFP